MRRLLALSLCASILIPSTALADEPSNNGRLTFVGTETRAAMARAVRTSAQNSSQQSPNDDKLLGMHWAVTQTLFAAGIGAAIGTFTYGPEKDAEGNALPRTAGDRARGALIGAAVGTGVWWLIVFGCSRGSCS